MKRHVCYSVVVLLFTIVALNIVAMAGEKIPEFDGGYVETLNGKYFSS